MALLLGLVASCSSNTQPSLQLAQTSEAGAPAAYLDAAGTEATAALTVNEKASGKEAAPSAAKSAKNEPAATTESTAAEAASPAQVAELAPEGKKERSQADKQAPVTDETLPPSPTGQILTNGGPILTAGTMPTETIEPKKKGFLSSFFGTTPAEAAAPAIAARQPKAKPVIALPDQNAEKRKQEAAVRFAALGASDNGLDDGKGDFSLPGVRTTNLFEIKRKSGIDDDSDIDVYEDIGSYQVASAAGMARLAPNGLLKQRETVDTACLKPKLVRMLKQVEAHFGKRLIVTSGYRSPAYNKKVRGAEKSQHMYCAAVDVQMPGVHKFELARYVRAMPGRGGVGTYCHSSIHIDIGPERDWNWKCGGRKS